MEIVELVAGLTLGLLALVALALASLLATQTWLAPRRPKPSRSAETPRPRIAVLMPAHDEAQGIARVIEPVVAELAPGDRLLVVADNCSDSTAEVARAAGAEVVERTDPTRRGKGFALDFGVKHLALSPPDVVVILDADCFLRPGSLELIGRQSAAQERPVQALYLMHAPAGAGIGVRIAAFAWVLKNQVRPLGFRRLGLPCQLMGTGMAFPWSVLRDAPLATGQIVEDLELGLELAARGAPPLFAPDALVESEFPVAAAGVASQRQRWEHGHLDVIRTLAPRLITRALRERRLGALALALDLCVPPLASFVLFLAAVWVAATGFWLLSSASPWASSSSLRSAQALPFLFATGAGLLLTSSVLRAWWSFGRHIVSLRELLGVPGYVLGKLPVYVGVLRKRRLDWVRTRRD